MRLLDAIRGDRTNTRYSFADYVQQMASFVYQGNLYTPPYSQTGLDKATESLPHDFEGMVRSAYYANGIVFACMLARRSVFSEGRFQWRQVRGGRLGDYFGSEDLKPLEKPWQGAGTGDLLSKIIDHADLAGNAYSFRERDESGFVSDEVVMLRPDHVDILLEPRSVRGRNLGYRKAGYAYFENGDRTAKPVPLMLDEVSHFVDTYDPLASFRGMSWITPVAREVVADKAASGHKLKFFEQGATPNMIVKVSESMSIDDFKEFMEIFDQDSSGLEQAYKTLFLGGGADVTVVGKDFQQMDFKAVQGAGETRIAAAAGVSPVVAGFSEGLQGSSLTTGNYMAARRSFADKTIRPLWRKVATSLEVLLPPMERAQLAVDTRDISFLSEDALDAAEIQLKRATTFRTLSDAGVEFESIKKVITSDDFMLAEDTGLQSVQLQQLGASDEEQPDMMMSEGPEDDSTDD